jgi:hypothetical protein
MSKVEVKFNFETLVESQNFFHELHLFQVVEENIISFKKTLYETLENKRHKKAIKEVELLEKLLNEYDARFSDFT